MAASETLDVPGESTAITADPTARQGPAAASARFPQLIPLAQLIAIVLGVLGIIWNQQQSIDGLRTELNDVETTLRAEINGVETTLRTELAELRAEVAANGQRLARIEGFLEIGIPDDPPE